MAHIFFIHPNLVPQTSDLETARPRMNHWKNSHAQRIFRLVMAAMIGVLRELLGGGGNSNIFCFPPKKPGVSWSNLTSLHIFPNGLGKNHQLDCNFWRPGSMWWSSFIMESHWPPLGSLGCFAVNQGSPEEREPTVFLGTRTSEYTLPDSNSKAPENGCLEESFPFEMVRFQGTR